jgi:hypothetical protein
MGYLRCCRDQGHHFRQCEFPQPVFWQDGLRFAEMIPVIKTLIPAIFLIFLAGCQYQDVSSVQMQIHQSRLDKNGLTQLHDDPDLKITCAPPDGWRMLPINKTILYTHQQWRSPDRHAGMGVAYIRMPIPVSADTVVWFAKSQYSKDPDETNTGGRLIAEWTDSLGRRWFEAENSLYHVRGYAMTKGFDAWIVYSGYRVKTPPSEPEIELAQKAAESVAPLASP